MALNKIMCLVAICAIYMAVFADGTERVSGSSLSGGDSQTGETSGTGGDSRTGGTSGTDGSTSTTRTNDGKVVTCVGDACKTSMTDKKGK